MARRRKPRKPRLTRAQRRERALNRDPLYNPAKPLSGAMLSRVVDSLVNLEYRPKLRALDREARTATVQGNALSRNAGDYYRQMAEREAGAVARQAALRAGVRTNLANVAQNTQTQISRAQDERQAAQAGDAALRGQGLGGTDRATAELAAARVRAAETGQIFQGAGEVAGANYEGLARSNASAREMRGGEIQGQLANRLANTLGDIRKRRSETESLRGASRNKLLIDLRQSQFENLATLRGLGIKEADIAASIQKAADDRAAATVEREDKQQFNAQQQGDRQNFIADQNSLYKTPGWSKGGKGGTQGFDYGSGRTRDQRLASRRSFRTGLANLYGATQGRAKITDLLASNPRKWGPIMVRRLVSSGVEEEIALAVVRTARGKPIGSRLRRQIMATYGFDPQKSINAGRPRRRRKRTKGDGSPGSGRPS